MAFQRDEFGRELRALLEKRRLSYRDVQKLTGIAFSQVGEMCAGKVRTRNQVQRLVDGLKLDPAYWMLKAGFVPDNLQGDSLLEALRALGDVVALHPSALSRPRYDRVSAGRGALPADDPAGVTADVFAPYDYTVEVRGDSMAGVLEDGDLAFVKAQADARSGDLVVAQVCDAYVVKRLRNANGMVTLVSENDNYEQIPASDIRILGVVTGVYRRP